ncbi:hypothetical protein CZ809_00431 [Photobacterium piscicola]|uniref:Tc1-like transposase DDE domain-containing protein n=1 Tax=Photobacterium piscicola TaxID=1378299 RepID=A0A1T5HVS9_9GAMM|nr:hypothetical protein CZ809_00431 [Photobacterium piscicola]
MVPWVNKEIMTEHLAQISRSHAIVVMDGAGWLAILPIRLIISVSSNFHPIPPELNPIEQVWSWLRQHYLGNQSFADYNDIVDKVCLALNRLHALLKCVQEIELT